MKPFPTYSLQAFVLYLDKRLQIPEVWFWEKEKLSLYQLQANGYVEIQQSQVLPKLDIALLTNCIDMTNHAEAVRAFRQRLE